MFYDNFKKLSYENLFKSSEVHFVLEVAMVCSNIYEETVLGVFPQNHIILLAFSLIKSENKRDLYF